MVLITGNLKGIMSIKIKPRHDGFTDQFSRIFMAKIFLIAFFIASVDFFNDKIACMIPPNSKLNRNFVHSVCWIQGFYIYEEMRHRFSESSYFGIPKDVEVDGIYADGKICRSVNKATHIWDLDCRAMTKIFYVQYQYFPFYLASLAIMFYMPYILFRMVNSDIISLRDNMKKIEEKKAEKIVANYFDYGMNGGKGKLRFKVFLNLCVKFTYVMVSGLSFYLTNDLLNGNFLTYGMQWLKWSKLNNTRAYDYTVSRLHPKPGNMLLPAMGFCDIAEGTTDVRHSFTNYNKLICEISPHILYQYVLIVLWFLLIISIVVAIIGVITYFVSLIYLALPCKLSKSMSGNTRSIIKRVKRNLTIREIEYLKFLRTKDLSVFGDVVRLLKEKMELKRSKSKCLSGFEGHELERLSNGTTRQRAQNGIY